MSDRTTTTSLIPLPTSLPAVSTSSPEPTSTSSTPQPSTSSSPDPSTSSTSTTSSSPPPTSQSSSSQIDSTSSSSAPPSSSSQSQSSSSTTSSESSSAQSTSSSSTQSASSSHLSTSFPVVTSNGQIYTQTAVVTIGGPTPTGGASDPSNRSTSNGFFHNKGAVAGVFAVVGIVVVIIAFVVITAAIRRRRQRKFDKEIDDAAAEAAAAPGPDFDDYDYTSGNTAGTGYGGYSDGSHGTFAQPPMSHQPGEAYNMSNIPPSQEYLAAAGAAGAAGIGAGVGAMQRARSRRDPQDPYGSFANREPGQYEMPDAQQLRYRGNTGVPDTQNPSYDLLAAAGLQGVGNDPYALTRGASQSARAQYPPQPQSQPGVARNPSNRDALSSESHYPPSNTSGQPYGQPPYYQESAPAQPQQQQARHVPAALAPGRGPADDSVYGGYLDTGATMPNPHSPRPNTPPSPVESEAELVPPDAGHLQHIVENDDSQPSFHDEEDYGYDGGRRVLRVANE